MTKISVKKKLICKWILPSKTYSIAVNGVPGFKTTPAFAPRLLICNKNKMISILQERLQQTDVHGVFTTD